MQIIISCLILTPRDILFPEPGELAPFVNESDGISTFAVAIRGLSGWGGLPLGQQQKDPLRPQVGGAVSGWERKPVSSHL